MDNESIIKQLEKATAEIQDINLTDYTRGKKNQIKIQNVYSVLVDLKSKLKNRKEGK